VYARAAFFAVYQWPNSCAATIWLTAGVKAQIFCKNPPVENNLPCTSQPVAPALITHSCFR